MKAIIISIALASFLLFSFCSEDSPTNSSLTIYKYTGYDSSWNKIIEGYLWIDSVDSVEVKGRWRFNLVSDCENTGPQIGHGNFDGTANMLGTMWLNLNPGMIDNNVLLEASMRLPDRLDGRWSYVGYPGVINWGRFEATQLR
jgi:hypothetical protein